MHTATIGTTTMVCTTATTPVRAVPSLVTRVRLATSLEDPRWTRGAARRSQEDCAGPSLWNTSTLMSCLLLTAGHRTRPGSSQDLPARLLDHEFGRSRVTRFEDLDFPRTLVHEPTRRFLRDRGLPEDAHPFRRDPDELPLSLPTLTEYCAEFPEHRPPDRADHLIRLGRLTSGDHVVVDGPTGAVLAWNAPDATLRPLTSDVSALALTLWALHRATQLEAAAGIEPA